LASSLALGELILQTENLYRTPTVLLQPKLGRLVRN
jgi:hypothetical protein